METGFWFADIDTEVPESAAPWVACVQATGSCHSVAGIWFYSKEDCEQWIKDTLVGAELSP